MALVKPYLKLFTHQNVLILQTTLVILYELWSRKSYEGELVLIVEIKVIFESSVLPQEKEANESLMATSEYVLEKSQFIAQSFMCSSILSSQINVFALRVFQFIPDPIRPGVKPLEDQFEVLLVEESFKDALLKITFYIRAHP